MYIHRIIVKGLYNFPERDLVFFNDWTEEPLHSVLLTGPNGTGKTTMLRIIAALWANFAEWLRLGQALKRDEHAQGGLLYQADLTAMAIYDLIPDKCLWLYVASSPKFREDLYALVRKSDTIFAGEIRQKGGQTDFEPKQAPWFQKLAKHHERLQVEGDGDSLPNLLYFDAEERQIYPPAKKARPSPTLEPLYRWLVMYQPSNRWEGHIEAMLRNLKIRDPDWFRKTVDDINQFFGPEKRLTDFDEKLRLRVEIRNGRHDFHYLDELSSGERQCLLLMFMVSRWLRPGGIVLIDEPDLHLHVSLQRHFTRALERVVEGQKGQLIITSHSPTLWEEYHNRQRFTLDLQERVYD